MKELGYIIAVIGIICEWASGSALWAHFILGVGVFIAYCSPKSSSGYFKASPPMSNAPQPPQPPPNPSAGQFFLHIGGVVKGPYTADQILALLDTGAISSDTRMCRGGGLDWKPISSFSF
jgi:hypothetical protein